ncbi:hypothetical protein [Porphyromonas somerae]|uniref:alpha-1,3-galactosidase-related protein n=1 Tax=Porphyromonas somerae TaxID=322095 RepID=UPI002A7FF3E3|nr:hypothetical protein [Porphyromonas somerae]MDY3884390.1 hypothetical protein [Porphyromonas somerae]
MKKILFILLSLFFLLCEGQEAHFYLSDYGAVVNKTTKTNGPALQKLLADAKVASKAGKSVTIHLPKGHLHIYSETLPSYQLFISNHDHREQRSVALMVEGFKDLTIKGDNTHLQFHGGVIPLMVKDSEKVTIEGFSIDYPQPAMTQIEVVDINRLSDEVVVQLLPETSYLIKDNQLSVLADSDTIQVYSALPFSADGHMKWGRTDPSFDPKSITEIKAYTLLLKGWGEVPNLELGDRYALRSYARPFPGIVITDSKRVKVRNVQVHFANGMGLLAQNSSDITLDHFSVSIEEQSPRVFTTVADATHFSGCRGRIISKHGLYENMADDAINVHGTYLRVDSMLSATEMIATFAHPQSFGYNWYHSGDTLRIISRTTLLPIAEVVPRQVEVLSPKQLKITMSEALPETTEPIAVENITAYATVYFANSIVRNNRARGALFSTPRRVECRGNLFDHTHGSAILLTGDANGWFESGPCEEVIIEDNHFINALTSRYQFTDGIISIVPQVQRMIEGAYYHGEVIVRNNRFDMFPSPIVYAQSLRKLVFGNNQVIMNNDYAPLFEDTTSKFINVGTIITSDPQ